MPLQAAFAPVLPDAADAESPINPNVLPVPGFVVKTFAMADSTKWFLNCCAHGIVDRPLANGSMEQVDDAYLDAWCLSNVQVPLHVCSMRTTVDHAGEASVAIDVVFHPALTARATAAGSKNAAAFQENMCTLAIRNVEKEAGVRLDKKGKVIRAVYKGGRGDGSLPMPIPELVVQAREQLAAAMAAADSRREAARGPAGGKKLVEEYTSWDEVERAEAARKAGARQAPAGGASGRSRGGGGGGGAEIKSGFLNGSGGKLYPNGSTEGTPAKNAGDPLGWMPEKLRARVQTVDTAGMSAEEQQRLMRVHAGLEEDPKKKAAREAREAAAEQRKMLEQVREALPSAEELEKLSAETDPEEFLNELRQVSEQMAALERGPTPQRAPGEPPGVSFAKAGFLAERKGPTPAGSSAGPPPSRVPEYRLAEEGEPGRALQLTVKLPGIGQIADLELDISSTLVILSAPGGVKLSLPLPRPVDDAACQARFSKKKQELRLTLPLAQ